MSTTRSLRERLPLAPQNEQGFRWRGEHVTRVESFTDAVFAFAVTLLVVALEVPKTYEGLMDVVRSLPAFIICFAILMTFWNSHFRFHRRYGMEDFLTRVLTMAVIVLVLFFVYPLKFLFTMVTVNTFGLALTDPPHLETREQVRVLYTIYGLGFAGIWGLYGAMYLRALRKRVELGLDASEILHTRASLAENGIFVAVCLLSVLLAWTADNLTWPGFIYMILGPLQALAGWVYGRRIRALPRTS